MNIYYVDGKYVPADEAVISVNDMIILRGYGVFDFMRTYNKFPFYLNEHIERLKRSADLVGISTPWSNREIHDIVMETIIRNPHEEELNIRIIVTGGISSDSDSLQNNQKLIVMAIPKIITPREWYTKGVKIITNRVERYIPEAKSTNYLSAVISAQKAKEKGAIESIYIDNKNRVLEGTTTNIFFIKNNKIITPGDDILSGITREIVIELLKDKFEIIIRDISVDEITEADEIFITASNKEIVPVIQVNDLKIGDGIVGINTKEILKIFSDYTSNYKG